MNERGGNCGRSKSTFLQKGHVLLPDSVDDSQIAMHSDPTAFPQQDDSTTARSIIPFSDGSVPYSACQIPEVSRFGRTPLLTFSNWVKYSCADLGSCPSAILRVTISISISGKALLDFE